jgi:hypothetical protein
MDRSTDKLNAKKIDRQIDRQTDRQTDRQMDRREDCQMDREQAGRHAGRYTHKILTKDGKYVQNRCYFKLNLLEKSYIKFGFDLYILDLKMKETVILVLVSLYLLAPII